MGINEKLKIKLLIKALAEKGDFQAIDALFIENNKGNNSFNDIKSIVRAMAISSLDVKRILNSISPLIRKNDYDINLKYISESEKLLILRSLIYAYDSTTSWPLSQVPKEKNFFDDVVMSLTFHDFCYETDEYFGSTDQLHSNLLSKVLFCDVCVRAGHYERAIKILSGILGTISTRNIEIATLKTIFERLIDIPFNISLWKKILFSKHPIIPASITQHNPKTKNIFILDYFTTIYENKKYEYKTFKLNRSSIETNSFFKKLLTKQISEITNDSSTISYKKKDNFSAYLQKRALSERISRIQTRKFIIEESKKKRILISELQSQTKSKGQNFIFSFVHYKKNKIFRLYKDEVYVAKPESYAAKTIDGLPQLAKNHALYEITETEFITDFEKCKRQIMGNSSTEMLKKSGGIFPDIELIERTLTHTKNELSETVFDLTVRKTKTKSNNDLLALNLTALDNQELKLEKEQEKDLAGNYISNPHVNVNRSICLIDILDIISTLTLFGFQPNMLDLETLIFWSELESNNQAAKKFLRVLMYQHGIWLAKSTESNFKNNYSRLITNLKSEKQFKETQRTLGFMRQTEVI